MRDKIFRADPAQRCAIRQKICSKVPQPIFRICLSGPWFAQDNCRRE
jgi:hypothetical protein